MLMDPPWYATVISKSTFPLFDAYLVSKPTHPLIIGRMTYSMVKYNVLYAQVVRGVFNAKLQVPTVIIASNVKGTPHVL